MNTRLRAWLATRSPRERAALRVGAVAAALWLGWLTVAAPWQRTHTRLTAQVQARTATLARLEAAAPALAAPAAMRPAVSAARLPSHSEQSLAQAGMAGHGARIEPGAGGEVRVRVPQAPFDAVLAWLALQAESGVTVSPLELRADAVPGAVSVDAQLRAGTPLSAPMSPPLSPPMSP